MLFNHVFGQIDNAMTDQIQQFFLCYSLIVLKTSPISTILIFGNQKAKNWADADQKQINSEHSLNKYIHKSLNLG